MLKLIEVKENTLTRYKQEENYIPAGKYYQYQGRPTDKQKKIYNLIACGGCKGYTFMWLAPYEPWVKRLQDGQLFKEPAINEEPDWSLIKFGPNKLRAWQKQTIKEAWNHLRSGLPYRKGWIAKLGAGKTLAGLLLCQLFEPNEAAVLVSRYLHSTWRDEAEKWGLECPIISTYEGAKKLQGIKCLIIDEVIAFKNPDAVRTVNAVKVAMNCEVVVGFTGIATAGKGPLDFRWLRTIDNGCVPANENAWKFLFGLDTQLKEVGFNKAYITTEWDTDKVSEFVAPFIHTVDPDEINSELPELTQRFIYCPKPKQYDLVKSGGATSKGVHKKLAQIKQITDGFIYDDADKPVRVDNPKLKILKEFIENLGEPVVIVANWSETIEILREAFASYMPSVVQGGVSDFGTQIRAFQQGTTDMMIVNAGFAKGMNLQERCRTICFLSVSSKPDNWEQMIGRVYRPGQKRAVQIVNFVCEQTVDARLVEMVQAHTNCSEEFIDKLLMEELGF